MTEWIAGGNLLHRLNITNRTETPMLRFLAGAVALAILTLPASAQNTPPAGAGQATVPPGNSGAGIPGQPGGKSGPAVKGPSGTTGAGANSTGQQNPPAGQDASKVQGLPGSKSGPAVKGPSDSTSK
jgi:hypothetical protein